MYIWRDNQLAWTVFLRDLWPEAPRGIAFYAEFD